MGHIVRKLTKEWDILTAKIPLKCSVHQYEHTHTQQLVYSHTQVETPRLKMGHLAEKLTKEWDILIARITLNTQQTGTSTHTQLAHTHTCVRIPQLKMGHLVKKLTKEWDILTAKIPLKCSIHQYEYTHSATLVYSHTQVHVGTPRLKMGHLVDTLMREWDILTAKIPLYAQQTSISTHTLGKFVLTHTVGIILSGSSWKDGHISTSTHTQQVCFTCTHT